MNMDVFYNYHKSLVYVPRHWIESSTANAQKEVEIIYFDNHFIALAEPTYSPFVDTKISNFFLYINVSFNILWNYFEKQ